MCPFQIWRSSRPGNSTALVRFCETKPKLFAFASIVIFVTLCGIVGSQAAETSSASQPAAANQRTAPTLQSLRDQIEALREYVATLEKENAELRKQLGKLQAGAKAPNGLKIGMSRAEFLSYAKIKNWSLEVTEDREVKIGDKTYRTEVWRDTSSGTIGGAGRVEVTNGIVTEIEWEK